MATRASFLNQGLGLYPRFVRPSEGSSDSLAVIYAAHYRHVFQVCRRFFRHREDAEDAAAEVFLKLPNVLGQRNESLPFRPWVSQVAGRHCIDKLRKRKRERTTTLATEDGLQAVPDHATPSPLSVMLRREKQERVREQLNRLPDCYRVPLILRYYKRMSYADIAHVLDRQIPTIKTLLYRAKNKLRRNLRALE
ncbi:MAG TPA: sigma-70 family RNA polymerase sigma factor [Dongiaceae bacterium]|nr:sigma-70 family RNA polymerase sigma factor [Dongiaceae bacterium]